jgi:hypothetical protein
MKYRTLALLTLGVIAGNYGWQVLADLPDWHAAMERSFFQIWIVGVICLVGLFERRS